MRPGSGATANRWISRFITEENRKKKNISKNITTNSWSVRNEFASLYQCHLYSNISDVSDQFEGIEPLPLSHISNVDDQSAWLYNWQIPVSGNKCRKQLLFGII